MYNYVITYTTLSSNRRKILHFWLKLCRQKQSRKIMNIIILTRNTLIDILANKVSSGAFFIFYRQFMKRGFFMNMRLSWNGWWRSWAFILFPWSYIICIEHQRWLTLKRNKVHLFICEIGIANYGKFYLFVNNLAVLFVLSVEAIGSQVTQIGFPDAFSEIAK